MFTLNTKLAILRALIFKKNPYYIQFYVNGVCNLMCKQCNIVETNSGIGEMSLDEIEIVAENIRKINGGIVLLTGGEPFLRKDIDQVAKRFLDKGLNVRLQTAGIATSEQLQKCYDVGARDINISLDSLWDTKQDYINSVSGSWKSAINAMERVSQIFHKGSAICSLGCVLSRWNFREIPAILEFATRIGWYVSLVPVHIAPKDSYYGFRSYEDSFRFADSDFAELETMIHRILAMKKKGALLFDAESYLWSSVNFLKTGNPTWRHKGICDSPNLYLTVRPNGDFTTCCDYILEKPPSLKDPDFYKRYKDGTVHKIADPIVKNCKGCHYGSYPEVTISVRDKKALMQRVKIALMQKKQVMPAFADGEMLALVEEVKKKYPEIYQNQKHIDPDLQDILNKWSNKDARKLIMIEDKVKRKEEGRIRHPKNSLVSV